MAHKIESKLVDFSIMADEPGYPYDHRRMTLKERIEAAEDWIREIKSFLDSHVDRPSLSLNIEKHYTDVCSSCNRAWEPAEWEENGKLVIFCAHCGDEIDPSKEKQKED